MAISTSQQTCGEIWRISNATGPTNNGAIRRQPRSEAIRTALCQTNPNHVSMPGHSEPAHYAFERSRLRCQANILGTRSSKLLPIRTVQQAVAWYVGMA